MKRNNRTSRKIKQMQQNQRKLANMKYNQRFCCWMTTKKHNKWKKMKRQENKMLFEQTWKLSFYYHLEFILRKILIFQCYLESAQTTSTQNNDNYSSCNTTFIKRSRKARGEEGRQIRAHAYVRRAVNRQPGFRSGDS